MHTPPSSMISRGVVHVTERLQERRHIPGLWTKAQKSLLVPSLSSDSQQPGYNGVGVTFFYTSYT